MAIKMQLASDPAVEVKVELIDETHVRGAYDPGFWRQAADLIFADGKARRVRVVGADSDMFGAATYTLSTMNDAASS